MSHNKAGKEAQDKRIRAKYKKILRAAYTQISTSALSATFDCSKSTANKIVNNLRKKGFLKIKKKEKQFLGFCTHLEWQHRELWWNFTVSVNRCFFYRGKIYFKELNEYKLMNIVTG